MIRTSPTWQVSILEPRPGNDYWHAWKKTGDVEQYRLFGKANVILEKNPIKAWAVYYLYRIMVLFYLLNPHRAYKAFFTKDKAIAYWYKIHYIVAARTLRVNFKDFVKGLTGKPHAGQEALELFVDNLPSERIK